MKSKIALVLCITQLCMLHSVEAATQKRVKTKVAKKSTLFKKIGSAVVIGAIGSAIAVINQRAEKEEIQRKISNYSNSLSKSNWSVSTGVNGYSGSCAKGDINTEYACLGMDPDTLMKTIYLDRWRKVLDLQPSEDPSPVLLDYYKNSQPIIGLRTPFQTHIILKNNISEQEAKQIGEELSTSSLKIGCCRFFGISTRKMP